MTSYQIFAYVVCFAFLILLSVFSAVLITVFYRMQVDLIRRGAEDVAILREYAKRRERSFTVEKMITLVSTVVVALIFFGAFHCDLARQALQ